MSTCIVDCDYEDDLIDEEVDAQNACKEAILFVSKNIKSYFADKKFKSGKRIDDSIYNCNYYINLLLTTTMSEAVPIAYRNMQEYNIVNNDEDEIRYVLKIIKNIQRHVPQDFVAGILLMHLELIEGIEICLYES